MQSKILLQRSAEAIRHLNDPRPPWSELLSSVSEWIGADGAALIVQRRGAVSMQQVGADPAAVQDYAAHFHSQDLLWGPAMSAPPRTWLDTQMALSSATLHRTAYFTDFMCKHRMRQTSALVLAREAGDQWASLGMHRAVPDSRLSARAADARFQALVQGIAGAIAEQRRRAEQCWLVTSAMLEALGESVLLLSPRGVLLHDGAGVAGLAQAALGVVRAGRLWHPSDEWRRHLLRALHEARVGPVRVRVPAQLGMGAMVIDCVAADPQLCWVTEEAVFVRVRPMASVQQVPAQALQANLPITRAEAQTLAALMQGDTTKGIARARGTSVHTVRKQIASLMQKLDCSRQLQLVQKGRSALQLD